MNWQNLKKNRCPKCNGDFMKTMVGGIPGLIVCSCGFRIRSEKYKAIVADEIVKGLQASEAEDDENFSDGFKD